MVDTNPNIPGKNKQIYHKQHNHKGKHNQLNKCWGLANTVQLTIQGNKVQFINVFDQIIISEIRISCVWSNVQFTPQHC